MTQPPETPSLRAWPLRQLLDEQGDAMMAARGGDPEAVEIANAFRREIQRRLDLLTGGDDRA